jgi:hypothetical protein
LKHGWQSPAGYNPYTEYHAHFAFPACASRPKDEQIGRENILLHRNMTKYRNLCCPKFETLPKRKAETPAWSTSRKIMSNNRHYCTEITLYIKKTGINYAMAQF